MSDYIYQFDDSVLVHFDENFESRLDDNTGYHEREYFDTVRMLLAIKRNGACLDVGAGAGRITVLARDVIAETVALEPDHSRWQQCHSAYQRDPDCQVLCQTTGDYLKENPNKQFDIAIVGMVIQHLSTGSCHRLMAELDSLLKPGALAVIYTTHTLEECKGYSFTGDNKRAYVTQEEFDAYAESKTSEQTMGLPVRRFSKQDLLDLLSPNLTPLYWRQTSYFRPEKVAFFARRLNVEPQKLLVIGNSQFVVAQKLEPGTVARDI